MTVMREYRRTLAKRIAEPFGHVHDEVDHDRRHAEERGAVTRRDQPESAGAHGFSRREVHCRVSSSAARAGLGTLGPVDPIAVGLRAVTDNLGDGQSDQKDENAGGEGRPAPAEPGEGEHDALHEQSARSHSGGADAERQGAPAPEPVHDCHRDGQEAAEARAERHQKIGRDERHGRADLAEQHEADAKDGHAHADERSRSEAIGEPTLDRA
jgi:hypothetical protein